MSDEMNKLNGKETGSARELDRMLSFYLGKVRDELERAYPDAPVGVILISAIAGDAPVVLTNLANGEEVLERALRTMRKVPARMVST